MFRTHGYFELIHSLSYSHLLRGIFPDASIIFDDIDNRPEITNRVNAEIDGYSELPKILDSFATPVDKKKAILEMLVRIYALEGIKFYSSFLITYVINNSYGNKIQGATRIIKLINFDEDMHTKVVAGTLHILRNTAEEGFTTLMASDWYSDMVRDVFNEVYEDELNWAKYLLSIGNVPTLTPQVMQNFLQYYCNVRCQDISCAPNFPGVKIDDTIQWFETYKDIDKDNVAQQEAEATNYNIGILQNDLPDGKI
jgi:ribonucleoside-diphosphate reductase beta chain